MAMIATAMAQNIIKNVSMMTDFTTARSTMWNAVREYVEKEAEVKYTWAGVNPVGAPDPMVVLPCTIDTSSDPSLSSVIWGGDPITALSVFTAEANKCIATWKIVFPTGFALSPSLVIPTVVFLPSMATDQITAMTFISQCIINGIKTATSTASGAHAAFVGQAGFVSIV